MVSNENIAFVDTKKYMRAVSGQSSWDGRMTTNTRRPSGCLHVRQLLTFQLQFTYNTTRAVMCCPGGGLDGSASWTFVGLYRRSPVPHPPALIADLACNLMLVLPRAAARRFMYFPSGNTVVPSSLRSCVIETSLIYCETCVLLYFSFHHPSKECVF